MKQRISALMDGELERSEAASPLESLREEGDARQTWRSYHLIGDTMRDTRMLSPGFAARVAAELEKEPTVMAPVRARQWPRWQMLSAAASVAAVAMVGWLAFGIQEGGPQLAVVPKQEVVAVKEATQVSPPDTANDYLYAHQGYSPRNSLQGVAPYVRTVSSKALVRKQ